MLVIGLTGFAASGKTTVANYLKKYGFEFLVFSDILKKEANKRGMLSGKSYEEQKTVLSILGDKLRQDHNDMGILARMLVDEIKNKNLEKVVIDGFKSKEEVDIFKDNFRRFYLIHLDTNFDVRAKRRLIEDSKADEKMLSDRDKRDVQNKGFNDVLKSADFRIDNGGSLQNLYSQTDIVLRKIL